jgi:hypothetical protein
MLAVITTGIILQSCTPTEKPVGPNELTKQEIADGWQLLFNGTNLDGWKRFNNDTIGPLWSVRDSAIVVDGTGLGEGSGKWGGSLMTTRKFKNFELSVDWNITTPGGNSGIIYHAVEDTAYDADYHTGPEMQVIDDAGWEGGELTAAQKVGSNYDMFPSAETRKVNPVGQWNTAKIVYKDGHVEHWLNGEKVVEFEEGSPAFDEAYKTSKWVDFPDWNKFKEGAISLQDHGAPVMFRNIKIREL